MIADRSITAVMLEEVIPMSEMRFDGRVAVITGAGGGLGREYALLLARRGARVLVNDLGCDGGGQGANPAMAQAVVDEIRADGGVAIANGDSVTTSEGANAIVAQALDAWGSIDILINNAGVVRGGHITTLSDEDYEFDMAVAAGGTMRLTRAVWRRMLDQNYGRIVNVSSGSVFGMGAGISYPATKAAVIGMTRGLAVAASMADKNIKVNVIMPIAYSRLSHAAGEEYARSQKTNFPPHCVAPAVALLCHDDAPCNGEILVIGGGRVYRAFLGVNDGRRGAKDDTIEDVRDHWDEVMDMSEWRIPQSAFEYRDADPGAWDKFKELLK